MIVTLSTRPNAKHVVTMAYVLKFLLEKIVSHNNSSNLETYKTGSTVEDCLQSLYKE